MRTRRQLSTTEDLEDTEEILWKTTLRVFRQRHPVAQSDGSFVSQNT